MCVGIHWMGGGRHDVNDGGCGHEGGDEGLEFECRGRSGQYMMSSLLQSSPYEGRNVEACVYVLVSLVEFVFL